MGPGTAAEVERRELRVDFTPSRAIAENLAAELPDVAPGARILLARAEEAREALPELLRARGAQVEIIPVYRTVQDERGAAAAASALAAGEVDAVTFTSASTVRQLVAAAGAQALGGRLIVSIGPVTSAAVHDHGLSVDVEATEHTIPGLVAALVEHARQQKRSGA
jgi:uroporphyrinogen III methyltransferase/synthase